MDNHIFIRTGSGHSYVYSDVMRLFTLIPPELQKAIAGTSDDAYYRRKAEFLKVHRFFDKEKVKFKCDYPQELIIRNLANLRQLLIEVTDRCNLKCKYCGYGEFYSNYDQRETKNQTFDNVKILVDYLVGLWTSPYNVSYNKVMDIGFYGGEPLLNMPLIRETIAYVERLQIADLRYAYNMTTNAVLLDHYMDYLVKKDFSLLISLDGGEYQDSYRVDKHGNASFPKVVANVKKLQQTYPDYFEKKVRFNAVLHDRNSVEECYRFIHDTFGKIPRTAALNVNGIIPERRKEFAAMFNDELASTQEAMKNTEVKEALKKLKAAPEEKQEFTDYILNKLRTSTTKVDSAVGGDGTPKPTFYSHVDDYRAFFYNYLLDTKNPYFKQLFFGITGLTAIGYSGKLAGEAIKDVQVKKINAETEADLQQRLVSTDLRNFKAKKDASIQPLMKEFYKQVDNGKPKEELKVMADNILFEIKNGAPFVYS